MAVPGRSDSHLHPTEPSAVPRAPPKAPEPTSPFTGLRDNLETVEAAALEIGKHLGPDAIHRADGMLRASQESKRHLEALACRDLEWSQTVEALTSERGRLKKHIKMLDGEVAMYLAANVYFKCNDCKQMFEAVRMALPPFLSSTSQLTFCSSTPSRHTRGFTTQSGFVADASKCL